MKILRIGEQCPECKQGTMQETYEAYECRCDTCGYWWDQWTQAEIEPEWEDANRDKI